jgi:hypothetical protein
MNRNVTFQREQQLPILPGVIKRGTQRHHKSPGTANQNSERESSQLTLPVLQSEECFMNRRAQYMARNQVLRKIPSPPLPEIARIKIKGIGFIAIKTENPAQLFIPSKKNYFGRTRRFQGLQFDKVKIDDGIDDILLFIPPAEKFPNFLQKLLEFYPKGTFSLGLASGINGIFPVLEIEGSFEGTFSLHLCTDILPKNKATRAPLSTKLTFSLCTEDLQEIVESAQLESLRNKLSLSLKIAILWRKHGFTLPRRNHVLIGQSVINCREFIIGSHEFFDLRIFYTSDFDTKITLGNLQKLSQTIYFRLQNGSGNALRDFLSELEGELNEELCGW